MLKSVNKNERRLLITEWAKKKKKVGGEQDEGQKVCSEQIESAPVSDARVQVHAEG